MSAEDRDDERTTANEMSELDELRTRPANLQAERDEAAQANQELRAVLGRMEETVELTGRDAELTVLRVKDEARREATLICQELREQKELACREYERIIEAQRAELEALEQEREAARQQEEAEQRRCGRVDSGRPRVGETLQAANGGSEDSTISGKSGRADSGAGEDLLRLATRSAEGQTPPPETAESVESRLIEALQAWNLPRLPTFSGEKGNDDQGLRIFIRQFENRAKLAHWPEENRLLQFEAHLTGRALRMFKALSKAERNSYASARDALIKRIRPVKLESFTQAQFDSREQGEGEAVNDFAEALQRMYAEGFQSYNVDPKLRDRMLVGQFTQGLRFCFKQELLYPIESFMDAVEQARLVEAKETQLLGRRRGKKRRQRQQRVQRSS